MENPEVSSDDNARHLPKTANIFCVEIFWFKPILNFKHSLTNDYTTMDFYNSNTMTDTQVQ